MTGTVWVFLVAAGLGFLWLVPHVTHKTVRAIAVRLGHLSLLGAGTIGAGGWLGTWTRNCITWVVHAVGASSAALVGTSAIVGMVALALVLAWILGILPTKVIKFDPPDWLAWAGLVLPAVAVQIPGPIGHVVQSMITGTGHLVVSMGASAVGA